MTARTKLIALVLLATPLGSAPALGQETPAPVAPPLEVGALAPDFELPGATRHGVLRDPLKLSDYKGKTVVLAFFFKARTKG